MGILFAPDFSETLPTMMPPRMRTLSPGRAGKGAVPGKMRLLKAKRLNLHNLVARLPKSGSP
jgi:hypothetical protein